jgi:hypothetical protein
MKFSATKWSVYFLLQLLYSLRTRSRVDPLINDACLLRVVTSLPRKREILLLSVRKKRKINTILPAVPTRSAFIVTLYSPGYTIEREKGKFTRGKVVKVVTSAHIGWLCGGGG